MTTYARFSMLDRFFAFALHPATLIAVGGAVGANARYWFGKLVAVYVPPGEITFPWATFAINVSGSIILGFVASAFLNHPDESRKSWYLLLGTGFCGGFTTFSTFSLEALQLMRAERPGTAAVYVFGSVAAGLLGVWLATKLGAGASE
ncbi:camphor resistance protein : Putative fluoride ion transporter CrcB OS=Prevotella oulorum F0390 GN=crcB PE=3 SV=1: CRCB [Gemmata massiliana]|uniref:Fluoride-specific ion channel FluC n=1 Tax=Gemmata massiliana TaxID=1210884 RepID=A0A6P2DLM6_9BACT|nr:fluoride efflux transporter CrcB [Gemmata massiliana]VTS02652.1 camphor resistance protein : Putative fluoride ion transporter CrcB OS=Prevotella oulorum F0390 GN=crcB PE=3 SV=1: CRCB [Gemmata massiliana]